MRNSIYLAILVAAASSQLGATDCGQAIRDSGFDLWCDGALCAWKVERGSVAQVPTWIQGDSGVQLVGGDTAIEQLSPVDSGDGTCIEFDLVANIDDDAEVDLNIDIDGDGTIDSTERLPTSHWQPLTYKLPIQAPFEGIRFELAKSGDGNAVLAQIQATVVTDCGGLTPIVPGPAPDGAACAVDGDCASAMCRQIDDPDSFLGFGVVCVGCDPSLGSAACGSGEVCGLADPVSPLHAQPIECEPAGARVLGERCAVDAECGTNLCVAGSCSICSSTDAAVCNGATCGPSWGTVYGAYSPWLCAPGTHAGATGAPCGTDDDCASEACSGTARSQCGDGRPCTSADTCPFGDDLMNGACSAVGIQGGRCE